MDSVYMNKVLPCQLTAENKFHNRHTRKKKERCAGTNAVSHPGNNLSHNETRPKRNKSSSEPDCKTKRRKMIPTIDQTISDTSSVSSTSTIRGDTVLFYPSKNKIPAIDHDLRLKPNALLRGMERAGDIFDHPTPALLIHACNCSGYWGKGIAGAFRQRYPDHFKVYQRHCHRGRKRADLLGTALLIPAQRNPGFDRNTQSDQIVWIGCLFTRVKPTEMYNRGHHQWKVLVEETLKATASAMQMLVRLVEEAEREGKMRGVGAWAMPRINAGLFRVDWDKTERLLKGLERQDDGAAGRATVAHPREVVVYVPKGLD